MTAREMMIMMMIAKTVWTFGGTRLKLLQDASCFTIFIGFFHSSHQQESAVGGSVCVPVSAIVEVTIHMPDFFFVLQKSCSVQHRSFFCSVLMVRKVGR